MKTIRYRSLAIILGFLVCWFIPGSLRASVLVDGIYYEINASTKTAEVAPNPNYYSGDIDIPSSFDYEGNYYNVTRIGDSSFFGCTGLTSVTIPNSVTSIGSLAFVDCTLLSSIDIPNSVIIIGSSAFSGCTGLTSVTISNRMYYIEYGTFQGCSSLAMVIIPNSVNWIGERAFLGCASLTSVQIPSSVTSIGMCAFSECTSLTSIEIPNGVVRIGNSAFSCCMSLSSVTIPNSITEIGEGIFSNCSNLGSIIVASNNHTYDSRDDCNAIIETSTNTLVQGCSNTVIPNSVTGIGDEAFYGCTGLASLTIPNSVTSIGDGSFEDCCGLISMIIPNNVSEIGERAFWGCNSLTTLSISNNVNTIGMLAFRDCSSLTSVEIPNSVTSIGQEAFSGCTSLTSLIIPNSVTTIGEYAFAYCRGLTSVDIPNSVTNIGYQAFYCCSGLTSVEIPNSVTSISDFSDCKGLASVVIPNSVTSIGESSFRFCSGLTSITIPNSVTEIGWFAFENCNGLTSLVIPNSVTTIGAQAFSWCENLTSIDIPSSVTSIGVGAFCRCLETSINVDPNNEVYDSRDNCNAIIETSTNTLVHGCGNTVIPNSVTTIGEQAFYCDYSINSVDIPNSVTSIGKLAFGGCTGLNSVVIPSSLTNIGQKALEGCNGLISITVESKTPASVGDEAFNGIDKTNCILYVPTSCKSAYENAEGWSEFQNIVESTNVLATGSCGDNVTYTIYSDQTMVISGNGPMWDYEDVEFWYKKPDRYGGYYDLVKKSIIEEGVTSVGRYAFMSFSSLSSLTISNTVTSIGDLAFSYCNSLTSITIPNSVTSIGWGAFYGCSSLNSLFIPANVSIIESGGSIYDLGAYEHYGVFYGCSALNTISVDINNPYYDSRDDCNAIIETSTNTLIAGCYSTIIPNGVTSIGEYAFYSCEGLTSIDIPNGVVEIDEGAFYNCLDLASVTIPNSVTSIGENAFDGRFENSPWYDNLYNNHPDGVIYLGKVAYKYKGTLPEGTEIIIEKGTGGIAGRAFYGISGLTSVTIPYSVISIGNEAFSGCTGLTSITCVSETPGTISNGVFFGVNKSTCTLYVPVGSKSAYENADGWCEFEQIVEYDPEPDTDISTLDNVIYVDHVEGRIGGTMDIPIKVKNSAPIEDFKFKMILPAGTTINSWALSSNRLPSGATVDDKTSEQNLEGNIITVACALDYNLATFTGNDGEIATVNVTFGENMEVGSYPIRLIECNIGHIDLSDVKATLNLEDYVMGDANGDGRVRIGDASAILHYIVGYPSADFHEKAADVNGDGLIRIGDVSAVLKIIVGL